MRTIGQRLKAVREEKHLTLEKVFEATRIRIQYLQALEADDHSVLPSPVQARGYLRNYAEYLSLDFEKMLGEMHTMNAQQASGEIIGPADDTASIPQPAMEALETEPIAQAPELLDEIQELPARQSPVEEVPLPIKPKPARRKKADGYASQPESSTAKSPTKQRGRKKIEPDSSPVIETEPVLVEEVVLPLEPIPQTRNMEEPAAPIEPSSQPVEEAIKLQEDTSQPTRGSDNLWQTWLSRLGSTISTRMKRRTLVPKDAPIPEGEPAVISTDIPVVSEDLSQDGLPENSNDILKEIGIELRERRELLSLHFDEVEHNTHVKARYLEALERGALDDLPSTVQMRGMLSNYASFLDLDVDALLLRFADALQARHRERNPQKPARKPGQPIIANMPPVRSFIAGDMIFGVGMAVLLVGFAIWGVSRVMEVQSQREIKPTAPSISDVLLASPDPSIYTATATFVPVESFPGEATVTVEIPTQNVNAEVQLNLVAVERTYMRVIVDGEVVFDGRVVPGNAYPFEAESQVEVLVGSGAAIRTVYNGRDLGLMGTFGQVVSNIYRATEIITPTAMPTATPTITLTPTNTVPPTATSRFTATPVPSATSVP